MNHGKPDKQNAGAGDGEEPSRSFSRERRLLRANDFRHVFADPVRVSDRYFTVLARLGTGSRSRLGLAIARKQLRRAVDRNRVKRLIREYFRQHQRDVPPVDFVVMARAAVRDVDNSTLVRSLEKLFSRLQQRFPTEGRSASE